MWKLASFVLVFHVLSCQKHCFKVLMCMLLWGNHLSIMLQSVVSIGIKALLFPVNSQFFQPNLFCLIPLYLSFFSIMKVFMCRFKGKKRLKNRTFLEPCVPWYILVFVWLSGTRLSFYSTIYGISPSTNSRCAYFTRRKWNRVEASRQDKRRCIICIFFTLLLLYHSFIFSIFVT